NQSPHPTAAAWLFEFIVAPATAAGERCRSAALGPPAKSPRHSRLGGSDARSLSCQEPTCSHSRTSTSSSLLALALSFPMRRQAEHFTKVLWASHSNKKAVPTSIQSLCPERRHSRSGHSRRLRSPASAPIPGQRILPLLRLG